MIPNPGSLEAKVGGCKCPVIDNRHGLGAGDGPDGRPVFVWRLDCPMHGGDWLDRTLAAPEPLHPCEDCGQPTGGQPASQFPFCGRCLATKFTAL